MSELFVGLQGFEDDIEKLGDILNSNELVEAVKDGWSIVTDQIVTNIASSDLIDSGLMINQKSTLTNAGMTNRTGSPFLYAEAGVFKSDSAMAVFGVSPAKDIPASLYAYWLEYGTQPHSLSSGIKAKHPKRSGGTDANQETSMSITAGIAPTFFISKAYDMKSDLAYERIEENIGKLIDRYIK